MPIWNSIKRLLRIENLRDSDEQARITRIQRTYDEDHQQTPATLTLPEYLNLLSGVPLPSTQQKTEFAEFVSAAHSWYKHLPANSPGRPFYFFLDKYAGCDRVLQSNGTAVFADRREKGFHYSDIPTAEYRSRFGYLAYNCSAGTSVFVAEWPLVYSRDKVPVPAVPGDDGKMYGLPRDILEVGETQLTAIIHPGSSARLVCRRLTEWPEELGGRTTLEKIAARCREMDDPAQRSTGVGVYIEDQLLENLVAPERQRQKREIIRSIDRVCELIRAGRT